MAGVLRSPLQSTSRRRRSSTLPKPIAEYPGFETPSTLQLVQDYELAARQEHYVDPVFQNKYQSKVGALIYAASCGRPGEALTIGILARALTFPTAEMDDYANRVLAYMAENADNGIEFKPGGRAELVAYSDSDWAVAHSTTGFCVTYGGAAIFYGSKRQHCISLSSTEAEIVAASHTAAEVIYLRGLLAEMGQEQMRPTKMHVDSSGAVELSKERRSCQRSRYVDRRDLKVREYVAQGIIARGRDAPLLMHMPLISPILAI
eukprot:1337329-Pleurochrysis_carterae.AAC.2